MDIFRTANELCSSKMSFNRLPAGVIAALPGRCHILLP
jgi:hypothetical protein